MKPDHKAAKEWAESCMALLDDDCPRNLAAAYLEQGKQLEAKNLEIKTLLKINKDLAQVQYKYEKLRELAKEVLKDKVFGIELPAWKALRTALEE